MAGELSGVPGQGWRRQCPSPSLGHRASFNFYFGRWVRGRLASVHSISSPQLVPHRRLFAGPESCDSKLRADWLRPKACITLPSPCVGCLGSSPVSPGTNQAVGAERLAFFLRLQLESKAGSHWFSLGLGQEVSVWVLVLTVAEEGSRALIGQVRSHDCSRTLLGAEAGRLLEH